MDIVKFYRGDPKNAPKTTMPAHLGANAILVWDDKLLLERRRDADVWGLVGGGCKKTETGRQAIAREVYEELGLRIPAERFRLEAGAAAVIFAACGCVVRGNFCTKLIVVVSAVVPTLIWIATCRLLGYGGLTDWNVTMMPRFEQVVYAALVVLNSLWKQAIPV